MKKIIFLLLFTIASYGQAVFDEGIQITGNANSATATKVNVQEANGKVNTQTINTGFNKNIGLGGSDVVGANTLLNQYSTTPIDWTATAFNSGQVVFYAGKQWIAKIATVAGDVPAVSSKWGEITFEALANKTTTVDQTIIDGSTNAVSGNAVFDGLATKAPISSVHNPVTLGTANGLSLSTQQLSLGLASSGTTGALSGTDWNTFNNKQPAITGLTTNYLPKWNGSGFVNSIAIEVGGEFKVNGSGLFTGGIKINYGSTIDAIGFTNTKILSTGYQSGINDYVAFFTPGSGGGGEVMRYLTNQTLLIGSSLENESGSKLQVNGTISASPATTANQVPTWGQVQAVAARPYKVYTALLTQTGTDAPTATVLENTLGGTIVWSRTSVGRYTGTLNNAFTLNKTIVFFNLGGANSNTAYSTHAYSNSISTVLLQPNPGSDNLLSPAAIEIRVYL